MTNDGYVYRTYPNTNIIAEPGKFEGEPVWLPDLWESVLDGNGDETIYDNERPIEVFLLGADLRALTDACETDDAVLVWETDQGFVCHRFMTAKQLKAFRRECETTDETDQREVV